jgi:hypothetical protein
VTKPVPDKQQPKPSTSQKASSPETRTQLVAERATLRQIKERVAREKKNLSVAEVHRVIFEEDDQVQPSRGGGRPAPNPAFPTMEQEDSTDTAESKKKYISF